MTSPRHAKTTGTAGITPVAHAQVPANQAPTPEAIKAVIHDSLRERAPLPNVTYTRILELVHREIAGKITPEERTERATLMRYLATTETHALLVSSMPREDLKTGVAEFTEDLIREYGCTTPSERSLCEMAAGSYFRIFDLLARWNSYYSEEFISPAKNGLQALIGKELDREHRTYLQIIGMLRNLRAPSQTINVRMDTGFIAANQQVNLNQTTP